MLGLMKQDNIKKQLSIINQFKHLQSCLFKKKKAMH